MRSTLRFAVAAILCGVVLAAPVHAQDAANGKLLYNTKYGTPNQSCGTSTCHGPQGNTLTSTNKIRNGVNNPARIQSAIDGDTGKMGFLKPFLNTSQVADIAAYLGNPSLAGVSAPTATASPATLSFAATNVGASSAAQTITLSNSGTAALNLSAVAVSSTAFRISGGSCTAGASVAAGGNCTVTVVFSPVASGVGSGSLVLSHNASPSTTTVSLSGTGVAAAPVASVSPTSLAFTQLVGTTSAAQSVSLTNTGTAPLTIIGSAFTGAQAAEFAVTSGGTCANGSSLAVAASCTYALTFTPAAAGARNAAFAISSNAGTTNVSLAGSGTSTPQPVIALNQNALAFGSRVVGASGTTQSITLTNSGQAALALSSLAVSGAQAADFVLSGTCTAGASVAVGANCSLTVAFVPGAIGARSASVVIVSNASNGTATAALSGTGTVAPAPVATLAPTTLAFGNVTVGSSVARPISLTNTGNAAMTITSIAANGSGYTASHNCPASLATAASCTVTLTLTPSAAGAASGQLLVTSNAPGSPHSVAVTGAGVSTAVGVLSWTGSTALNFADTALGATSATQTLTLTNAGPAPATLSALSAQGASAGEFTLAGSCAAGVVLAANASCTVVVAFVPAQLGVRSASLSIASDGSNPAPAALLGQGIAAAQGTLRVAPATVSFAATLGNAPPPLTVEFSNGGTTPVAVSGLAFASADFGWQTVAQNGCGALPWTLAPAATCQIEVSLNPTQVGALNDSLSITSNATDMTAAKLTVSASIAPGHAADGFSNAGQGGCSIVQPGRGRFDPLFALLVGAALLLVWRRRRTHLIARASSSHQGQP